MKSLLRSIPSEARIVFVILVAIVLPSVLLSIFAVWAIGTEREQVQERIRRQAHAMTEDVVETVMSVLNTARSDTVSVTEKISGPDNATEAFDKLRSSYDFLSHYILMDDNRRIVYPHVPQDEEMIFLLPFQTELHDALRKAHNLEFIQIDLEAAASAYKEICDSDNEPYLAASALLGLARIYAKQEKWLRAIETYQIIKVQYAAQRDENGFLLGPISGLRSAEIFYALGEHEKFVDTITNTYKELCAFRSETTRQEATFLDLKFVTLAETFIERGSGNPVHNSRLSNVIAKINQRQRNEIIAIGAATEVGKRRSFDKDDFQAFESEGQRFILLGAPVQIKGSRFIACSIARIQLLESKVVAAHVARIATSEEVGVVVTRRNSGIVAGEEPPARSYRLSSDEFPEPLADLRVDAYLKGYESLAALSSIRTNIYVWAVALAISGIIAGAIVTYISVTRTMRAAELKSDFVSNVTHELKTPLTSIRMFAETLYDNRVRDEEDAKECLQTIVAESERLSNLIDRVLDFRAIEKGKRKFDFRVVDLREVVLETLQTFRRQMRGYEATVFVNIPHDLPHVRMDPDAIGEVMLNLLTNAYKYSQPENRKIWVNAQSDAKLVRVSVKDQGIGIPKREQKAIFEKFYRVNDLLTREVDGTGLGLTISKHVAEAHGGTIEVESNEGKGSKFTLVLKRK